MNHFGNKYKNQIYNICFFNILKLYNPKKN